MPHNVSQCCCPKDYQSHDKLFSSDKLLQVKEAVELHDMLLDEVKVLIVNSVSSSFCLLCFPS